MSVLFSFLGKLFWGVSSKFLRDSMGNSYCKKDYSKGEVNIVEIARLRLQKLKKIVDMASFYCLVGKIWKKNTIL